MIVWRVRGRIIRSVLCSIVCNNCAQCNAHTYEQTNSSLDWVLSHWAHFTVLRFIFCVCIILCLDCTLHACVLCSIVTWWGGPGGIEAWSLRPLLLQCFDTVCWVIWPVKPVPDMTYNVFSGTLNPTQSINLGSVTARHSSSGRQPNCGVEQRVPPIFGRAAITLGIGPHF